MNSLPPEPTSSCTDTLTRVQDYQDLALLEHIKPGMKLFCLGGAGCSTASGLGDYRDKQGQWKRAQPITGQVFKGNELARKRYWLRSAIGWPVFSRAQPSLAHYALQSLEKSGVVSSLVTQNVDELHQQAGHKNVIDLHGVLSTVSCLSCKQIEQRDDYQLRIMDANRWINDISQQARAALAPDGDADVESSQIQHMQIPNCVHCGGMLKPDVVFFGENVPRARVTKAMEALRSADAILVAGSSLMVFSGYRFCRDAQQRGQPIFIINDGVTRADDITTLKVSGDCGTRLQRLAKALNR